jgi:hypothetical protein
MEKVKDYLSPKRLLALLNKLSSPRSGPFAVVLGSSFGCLSLSPCCPLIAVPVVAPVPPLSVSLTSVGVLQLADCVTGGPANIRVRHSPDLLTCGRISRAVKRHLIVSRRFTILPRFALP